MSFLKDFMSKISHGFLYVVDINTLVEYINEELKFSLENNLEASAHCNIYYNGEKHEIQVWNHAASNFKTEQEKGLIVYYDDLEFKSVNDLMENAMIANIKLKEINEFFKIELIDTDSVFLNDYKKNHPELNVENYN